MTSFPQSPSLIYLVIKGVKVFVSFGDIIRLQSDRNYTLIFLADGRQVLASKTLGSFEKRLPNSFLRVHRSHIVNVDAISHLDRVGYRCILKDGQTVKISHQHFKKVKSVLSISLF
jgi:two-component system LytT family response regulator